MNNTRRTSCVVVGEEDESEEEDGKIEIELNHIYFYGAMTLNSCLSLRLLLRNKEHDILEKKKKEMLYDEHHQNENQNKKKRKRKKMDHHDDELKLYLHISSEGGDAEHAFMLVDVIMNCRVPVVTIIDNIAGSSASLLFLAGHERKMLPHAKFMLHPLTFNTVIERQLTFIKSFTLECIHLEERFRQFYLKRTQLPLELINTCLEKEQLLFYKDDCLKYGIVTTSEN
jgi:ATP-dependent protease ClpP protease subunit